MNVPKRDIGYVNKYQALRECFDIKTSKEGNEKAKKYNNDNYPSFIHSFKSLEESKPPPIHVHTPIINYFQFGMYLQEIFMKNFVLEYLEAQIKIQFYYTMFKDFCDNNYIEYHTYDLDSEKTFSLVLKGLKQGRDPLEITKELKNQKGLEPVSCQLQKHEHVLYPAYKVTFKEDIDPNSVMEVKKLFNLNTYWKKYEPKQQVEQCQRCQAYGHSANNCTRSPKCMKCAKKHATQDCTKPKDLPSTCCNCNGSHSANYSLCPSYLAFFEKQKKDINIKKKEAITDITVNNKILLKKPIKTGDSSSICINDKETQTTSEGEPAMKVKESINILCDVVELLEAVKQLDSLCDVKEMIQTVKYLSKKLSQCKNNTEKVIAVLETLKLIDN